MFAARKGDPLVCPNGHVCGRVERDVAKDDVLYPTGDFSLIEAGKHTEEGHYCPRCGAPVTKCLDGRYRILIRSGWIGGSDAT